LRERQAEVQILLGDKEREAGFSVELQQRSGDFIDDRRLNPFRRLVEKQYFGLRCERSADRQHLLLPAAQGYRKRVCLLPKHRKLAKHPGDAVTRLMTTSHGCCRNVLCNRQSRKHTPALGHIAQPEPCTPRCGLWKRNAVKIDCARHLAAKAHRVTHQGRLAYAVASEQSDDLSRFDTEAGVMNDHGFLVSSACIT
jgi:hypothetical protein